MKGGINSGINARNVSRIYFLGDSRDITRMAIPATPGSLSGREGDHPGKCVRAIKK